MKKHKAIIVLSAALVTLVLLFTNNIFLKEEPGEDPEAVNISLVHKANNNFNESSKYNTDLEKSPSIKQDSTETINYIQLHYDAILVDTHNDFIWKVYDKGASFNTRNSFTQSDLPRFQMGGVDVQVFAVWIPLSQVKKSYNFVVSQINRLHSFADENPAEFEFANNYDDIIRITDQKKLCGLIGIEGGTAIGNNPENINAFFEMGVRYIGLTWNNSNLISTSARDETERGSQGGLTDFGIEVIKKMNETGMLIDVSHLSEAGFWDVIKNSTSPIIASHSDCYSINPHYRNLTDEQIKAIAENGGYIGINFYDIFLDKDADRNRTDNAYQRYSEELNELNEKYGDDLLKYNEERDK
ncbi:MAG: membrane dipeptidase, partial [Ignavibacteria bacterium]